MTPITKSFSSPIFSLRLIKNATATKATAKINAVGVTINWIDAHSGQVKWSAVGSRSGGSRAALSAEGQKLIRDMLNTVNVR